jgi:hypothetical protein
MFVCAVSSEGAPSLRFLQGWAAMLPVHLICYVTRRTAGSAQGRLLKHHSFTVVLAVVGIIGEAKGNGQESRARAR